jgi:succinoglycan biosynthesis protein ExoM
VAAPTPNPACVPAPLRLVVCLATCLRPQGLLRLLQGLANSEFDEPAPHVEIVVIDNDAAGSARDVCESARDWFPFQLHYAIEKRRGIPQARNAALAIAMPISDFIAFTDDDVEPTSGWLAELLRVQSRYDADVVAGPNPPRFLEQPPEWIVAGGFLESARRETGTLRPTAATNNVLIRRSVLDDMDRLFDERRGLQGGEDSEFFKRVVARGHEIIWADDAVVYECIPASRTTRRWLVRRAYRVANGLGGPQLRALLGMTRRDVGLEAARCLIRGGLALARSWNAGTAPRVKAFQLLASGAGWISGMLGFRYSEYTDIHGH